MKVQQISRENAEGTEFLEKFGTIVISHKFLKQKCRLASKRVILVIFQNFTRKLFIIHFFWKKDLFLINFQKQPWNFFQVLTLATIQSTHICHLWCQITIHVLSFENIMQCQQKLCFTS